MANSLETTPPRIEVLYEDGPCLVVNKPAGILTQAPAGIASLENEVKRFYRTREGKTGNIYLGVPHRLDRPVSGAMVFARHVRAARRLAEQFERRTIRKTYWAFVEGRVTPDAGQWKDYLHKRHGMAQAIVVADDDPRGKLALLEYRVRHANNAGSWLEIELQTGRTHQVRVQAATRGHPVEGDVQYGAARTFGDDVPDERMRPIALHARELAFTHPMTKEPVRVAAPLPRTWDSLELPLSSPPRT